MNTDEPEQMGSVSRDENTLDADRQIVWHRGRVLGLLIAALILTELSKDVFFSTDRGEWLPACMCLYYAVYAFLPFLLSRMAPEAASFDTQWFRRSRWQWAWFLGMIFFLIAWKVLVTALATTFEGRPSPRPFFGPTSPIGIVFLGIAVVFIAPIAEEIFFRGYVLAQLRKLTHSGIALLIQALLFGLFHLYAWGWVNTVNTFFLGMIFGAWRIKFKSLLPLVLAHILFNSMACIVTLKARYDQATAKAQVTISEETTYITGPVRKDGCPDYVAALNERSSQGITPENNALLPFWKAMGPEEIIPKYRDRYFQMLGMAPLPEKGDYFVDLKKYLARQKDDAKSGGTTSEPRVKYDADKLLAPALEHSWGKDEYLVLAAWLAANRRPLALVTEASKRPRYYDPLVCGETTPLIAVMQPALSFYHCPGDPVSALVARAMLRLGEDRVDRSWEDLLTCHRLARLVGQGPTAMEAFVARSLDTKACAADRALLRHVSLTATQIARMREDIERLPALPPMADRIDEAERFAYLNIIADYSRQGRASLGELQYGAEIIGPDELPEINRTITLLRRYSDDTAIDWDIVLRLANCWFDRIGDAYRKPTRAARREAMRELTEDFREMKKTAGNTASLDEAMLGNPRKALSERLGQVILVVFSPASATGVDFENRTTMTFQLTRLAFTLAAYHADHGSYPVRLADLTPKYISEVPKDIFNDAQPHYRQEGKGYCLYSVGDNGKDDEGRGFENGRREGEFVENDWDDLVVRVPATEQK